MARHVPRPRARRARRRRARRRGRHLQPARLDDRVGPRDRRADRARRSAGRTCAPSARASRCGPTACASGPNQSATKLQWLLDQLDDRGRAAATSASARSTRGSRGRSRTARVHVTDATNAAVTGLLTRDDRPAGTSACSTCSASRPRCCRRSSTRPASSATRSALPGAPPIAALVGDQQASLVGQGCVRRGDAKITFGTGGMLDLVLGDDAARASRNGGEHGTFPIVAWRHAGRTTWGIEAIMLAAGTNVQWLRDDLGLIATRGRVARARGVVRRHRRRRVRARAARARHPGVGLRRARRAVRAHARHRARRDRARRARGHRAPRRRPRRRGRGRQRHRDPDAPRRRRHDRQPDVRPGARRRRRSARSRSRRCARRPRSAPRSSPASPSATTIRSTTSRPRGSPGRRVEPARPLDRDRWHDAVERSRRWIPELSGIDF